ncbi:MAG TPA: hypothetical protein PK683_03595 [Leptospiraceae bacterium]|nr:hypothetical protein [Leptospiraceae bacterium]
MNSVIRVVEKLVSTTPFLIFLKNLQLAYARANLRAAAELILPEVSPAWKLLRDYRLLAKLLKMAAGSEAGSAKSETA